MREVQAEAKAKLLTNTNDGKNTCKAADLRWIYPIDDV